MNPHGWQDAKRLFQAVIEMADDTARAAFLDAQCGSDGELRRDVDALIAAHAAGASFLSEPAHLEVAALVSDRFEADRVGLRIGAWRLERVLDRGGMGTVYLCERADGAFAQQAALKLLRPGLDTRELVRRFERERQILAGLDHPNIARLLDGGATTDGHPYLVMEYIDGQPIDRWCDAQRLGIGERIDLLRRVCDAVQHAHQKLVIHCDLKPSNILVTADGEPRLLDFGIARLVRPDAFVADDTATVQRLLSPDYASPEQVRGEPVSTATDVHALGILLHQLICGDRPYRVSSLSPQELLRTVCEQQPAKPSAMLRGVLQQSPERAEAIAMARATRPRRLVRALEGDLDTIVMTALRKEPARRYATPAALGADLARLRKNLPIHAQPDRIGYRLGKFVARHRTGVAAAAVVLLALVGGLGAALWQAQRATLARQHAEARFNDVRELAIALVFDLHNAIANLPGSTRARQLLVARALTYLEILGKDARDDAQLAGELAGAYIRIGDAQGHPEESSLGDLAAAAASYRKALALRRDLVARTPQSAEAHHQLAIAIDRIGMAEWWQGDNQAALASHADALAARQAAIWLGNGNPLYERGLADTHEAIGKILTWDSRLDEAIAHFDQALTVREAHAAATPGDADRVAELGATLVRKGYARAWQSPLHSLPIYERAIGLLERGSVQHPNHRPLRLALARARSRLAESFLDLERYEESIAGHQASLDILGELVGGDPHDVRTRAMLALQHAKLSDTYLGAGHYALAEAQARKSLDMNRALADDDPDNAGMLEDVASSHQRIARTLEPQHLYADAREHYEQALELRERLLQRPASVATDRRSVASILLDLGDLEYTRADAASTRPAERDAARRASRDRYEASLAHWQQLVEDGKLFPQDQQAVDHVRERLATLGAAP